MARKVVLEDFMDNRLEVHVTNESDLNEATRTLLNGVQEGGVTIFHIIQSDIPQVGEILSMWAYYSENTGMGLMIHSSGFAQVLYKVGEVEEGTKEQFIHFMNTTELILQHKK